MYGTVKVGDRVRLVRCTDQWTKLHPGELGTVSFIDDTGTVFVDWDSGSSLGLVDRAGDRFEVVEKRALPEFDVETGLERLRAWMNEEVTEGGQEEEGQDAR